MAQTLITYLTSIFGNMPYGYGFLYYLIAMLLLVFVFHLIEHIFEIFFSKFFK